MNEISLNFRELLIIGKCVKVRYTNGGHHAIFSVLEAKRSNILQKFFLFAFLVSFFCGASRAKTDLHMDYII